MQAGAFAPPLHCPSCNLIREEFVAVAKRKPTIYQFVIHKFLDNSEKIWKDKLARGRELGTVKKLIEIYPDKSFWASIPKPFKMDSLVWFLTPKGKEYLLTQFRRFSLDLKPKEKYSLSSSKIGAKKITSKKNKLFDFLRNGSKKEN